MSAENVYELMKRAAADAALRQRIDAAVAGKQGRDADQAVAELARGHGLEFTAEESFQARAALKQRLAREGHVAGELSDAELEAVAGGALTASLGDTRATLPIPLPMPAQLFLSHFGSW